MGWRLICVSAAALSVSMLAGCGDDGAPTGGADSGGGGSDSGGAGVDGGGSGDDGGMPGDDGGSPSDDGGLPGDDGGTSIDAAACDGVHPTVEGDRRFCQTGRCYCAATDACFPVGTAVACCAGDLGACGPPETACMGAHPNVEGDVRSCDTGACYCANPDACFPASGAAACCAVDVVCE